MDWYICVYSCSHYTLCCTCPVIFYMLYSQYFFGQYLNYNSLHAVLTILYGCSCHIIFYLLELAHYRTGCMYRYHGILHYPPGWISNPILQNGIPATLVVSMLQCLLVFSILKGDFGDFSSMYVIQHFFICRPSASIERLLGSDPELWWLWHWQSTL